MACGGTAVLSVNPTVPHGPLTYQWRRNMIPLTDTGHIAGATTPTLTVNNACDADSGRYDVVVSDGTIVQPSRLARLRVATTTSVNDDPVGLQRPFSLEVTGPNPFGRSTSFRYSMAKPQQIAIDIYNATGAKIRSLSRGLATGSGTVTWDGNTNSGSRAPAGIYFLRFEAGNALESRKVVLLR